MSEAADELAFAGDGARPRPRVIDAARAALLPDSGTTEALENLDDHESWQVGRAMFRHATRLRKAGQNEDALPHYFAALTRFERVDLTGDVSACLTGAGLSYLELATAALREDWRAIAEASKTSGRLSDIFTLARAALTRRALPLAEKSRLCHLWALELQKERQDVGGQAARIANLAITEQLLGNLDTARRYVCWALAVHREHGDSGAVGIDLALLADIDRALGDEDAAAEWERERAEITGEAPVEGPP